MAFIAYQKSIDADNLRQESYATIDFIFINKIQALRCKWFAIVYQYGNLLVLLDLNSNLTVKLSNRRME